MTLLNGQRSELRAGRSGVSNEWRWQDRAVRLVVGTTATFPDTPANQQAYPQQNTQTCGLEFPIARLVHIICLSSDALLNAAMGQLQGKGAISSLCCARSSIPSTEASW